MGDIEEKIFGIILGRVQEGVGQISVNAKIVLRSFGHQLALMAEAYANGEISKEDVAVSLNSLRYQMASFLALNTVLVEAQAEKLVNNILKELRDIINKTAGFALL